MSPFTAEDCPKCGAPLPLSADRLTCIYCGSRLIRLPQPTQTTTPGQENVPAQAWVQGLRLKTYANIDTQGTGLEAFRMLIPSDWETAGGIQWQIQNPGRPAVVQFKVYNPAGVEAFEIFPALSFYWTSHPLIMLTKPRGSSYFGNEVQPPCKNAIQALQELAIPRYRRNFGRPTWLHQENLPDLPRIVGALDPQAPPGSAFADGAKVRFRYQANNSQIDEEMYGVLQIQHLGVPGMMGAADAMFWAIDYLFSFRAPCDQLDQNADLFRTIVSSYRMNPRFFATCVQVSQMLIQNQIHHIHQIGQISRQISQYSSQISDQMMQAYQNRQDAMDRISTNISQTIRGVDEFYDPFSEKGVELPGGYGHAWANNLGEYIVTEDPNFNPNLSSNLSWQPLDKKP